jgi:hypothetical protein
MQQHHQQLLEPPAQTQAPETAGAAAGCGVASASSSRSSVAISQDSKAACVLDFGIVAAGLQVQKSFYVSNTGVPHLWHRLIRAGHLSCCAWQPQGLGAGSNHNSSL